jgi:LysR family cys regulon transcriptional activator
VQVNFQQLRIVREMVRRNFNVTEVAGGLFTSQSGVSKHIRDLEDELGIELFVRKGKRVLGLTEPGKELVEVVERILLDAGNIKTLAEHFSNRDQGRLIVATTHTQARYALPPVVTAFKRAFPRVHLVLYQASPAEIVAMLLEGRADIGVATEELGGVDDLVAFPYYAWHHAVIVPAGHALETAGRLTLEAVAEFPIVTYHEGFTGRARIDGLFARAGVVPDIVMSALDADVIKTYVELGLGIGIIASMAFDRERDGALRLLGSRHLFEDNTTQIAVRRGHYLRGFSYRFMEMCSPALAEPVVREAIRPARDFEP